MFAGNDYVLKSNGTDRKRAYSTYVELGYPFSVKGVDLVANVGLSHGNLHNIKMMVLR